MHSVCYHNGIDNKAVKNKSFEIKKILLGFILTTIVGGFIAFFAQYIHNGYTYKRNLLQSEKINAQKHFETLSSLLDTRMYLTRKLCWIYTDSLDETTEQKRWDDYSEFLYVWNSQINKNLALTERYFGESKRTDFNEIHSSLSSIGNYLQEVKKSDRSDSISLSLASRKIEEVNPDIYFFDIELLNQIKSEKVGVFVEE